MLASAIGDYTQKLCAKPAELSPVLSRVMAGFVDREQMKRLIPAVKPLCSRDGGQERRCYYQPAVGAIGEDRLHAAGQGVATN